MHGNGYGWGMGMGGWLFMILFWVLIILAVVYIARAASNGRQKGETALDMRMKDDLEKS